MKLTALILLAALSHTVQAERKPNEPERSFTLTKAITVASHDRVCLSNRQGIRECDVDSATRIARDSQRKNYCYISNDSTEAKIIPASTVVSVARANSYRASFTPAIGDRL